jgi:hypothetical protein
MWITLALCEARSNPLLAVSRLWGRQLVPLARKTSKHSCGGVIAIFEDGHSAQALEQYQRATGLDPEDPDVLNKIASCQD